MDPLDSELLLEQLVQGDPLNRQFGQWVAMTPPETALDWRPFLEYGRITSIDFLATKGLVPVGDPQWIEHEPDDLYAGGTYGWKQTFVMEMK